MPSNALSRIVHSFPGKRTFGLYRFLPIFFVFGGLVEFSMIHLRVGNTNFYEVYKRKHPEVLEHQKAAGGSSEESSSAPNLYKQQNNPKAIGFLQSYQEYLKEAQRSK